MTAPIVLAHEAILRARAAAYDRGLLRTHRVPGLTVVSVGGLTTGGDGKTPLAIHMASELTLRGLPTALVSRGYRGLWERGGGVVSDGHTIFADCREAGDEAMLCAKRLRGVCVVVGADRVRAASRARSLGARAVVLDSGFQHRRLARDLDVLALRRRLLAPGGEQVLPAGTLREPAEAAARADLLGFYDASPEGGLPSRAFTFRLEPVALVDRKLEAVGSPGDLAGRRVLVLAGIARPARVVETARSLGAVVAGSVFARDHQAYGPKDHRRIRAKAEAAGASLVLTTEKDVVRLGDMGSLTVRALRVDVVIEEGEKRLKRALDRAAQGR